MHSIATYSHKTIFITFDFTFQVYLCETDHTSDIRSTIQCRPPGTLTQSEFWIRNPISSRPLKCYSNLFPNHFIHLTFEFTSQYPLRNHFVHLTFEFTFYAPGIINFIQLTFEKLFTHFGSLIPTRVFRSSLSENHLTESNVWIPIFFLDNHFIHLTFKSIHWGDEPRGDKSSVLSGAIIINSLPGLLKFTSNTSTQFYKYTQQSVFSEN